MVAPETQLLINLLHEKGDEMNVDQMRSLILRLGNELGAAQQAAGVTGRDFQRIEAECAHATAAAGMANVERRVDAAQKKMFDALQPLSQRCDRAADTVLQNSSGGDCHTAVETVTA